MISENRYPNIFKPLRIRGQVLKNRLAFAPFVCCLTSPDGAATAETIKFFEEMSKTGVAYITIGDTQIDHEYGACFAGELNVTSDMYLGSLYSIVEAIHRYGAKASIELSQGGRGANPKMITKPAFAPSNLPIPGGATNLKVMDEADMEWVTNKFIECAKRCELAGFDMIMFHSAHNNLFGQFLSPASNIRTDEYGGSLENRMRFPLSVIKAVREALKPTTIIEMRISGDEMTEPGLHFDESLAYAREAAKYVDIVHFSRGNIFNLDAMRWVMPNYMMPAGYNLEFSRPAKKVLDSHVAVVGGFQTLEHIEQVLADGEADIVAMAHALIADPELIHKSIRGEADKVRTCLRCQEGCGIHPYFGFPVRCAINPTFGRELTFANVKKAEEKKKIVIVGGGPAGMQAAQTLKQRGHDVVLIEKSDKLGGLLHEAGAIEIKKRVADYAAWAVRATNESGAVIKLNTEATIPLIQAENPDEIIVATGSIPVRPDIPGIDKKHVKMISEIDKKSVEIGQNVVVCGAGLTGMESAIQLAMDGKEVIVIDMIPIEQFGAAYTPMSLFYIFPILQELKNIKLMGDSKISQFTDDGVEVISSKGEKMVLKADTIALSLGMKPNNSLYHELLELYPFNTHIIGDCGGVKNIRNATRSAYELAVSL